MSINLLADLAAIDHAFAAGSGSGRGPANLWRAGLRVRTQQPSLQLNALPELGDRQTLLARYLSHELPGPLAQRGGRRLSGCCAADPCTSAACPVCRTLGDAWLAGTCRRLLEAKPHGWLAFGGLILDRDPIGTLDGYTRERLGREFDQSLRALGLDHLDWHGRFAFSVQANAATREDSITISVAAAATTGPYHDLGARIGEQPLGAALAFRAAAAVEPGAARCLVPGFGDAGHK